MREVIAGIVVLVCLILIPGSAFAYWVPDSFGQGINKSIHCKDINMKSIVLILMKQLDIDMQRLENMNGGEAKRG
jgi:hypothetical protein